MATKLTSPMRHALATANKRPDKTVCPIVGKHGQVPAAASDRLEEALHRRGLITYDSHRGPYVPVLSEDGVRLASQLNFFDPKSPHY